MTATCANPQIEMTDSSATHDISLEPAIARVDELARLQSRVDQRKSALLYGEKGVGKTYLLRRLVLQPNLLYVRDTSSPRNALLLMLEAARQSQFTGLSLPGSPTSLSLCGLKGVVQRVLSARPWTLLLDHVEHPSPSFSHLIKELNYYGRTPIIFAARSPHMEHIGHLQALCSDRSEQVEIKNWAAPVALKFAQRRAREIELGAQNLDAALEAIVDMSSGNPGAMVAMLDMATRPHYRSEGQIKFHVLYVDYRLSGSQGFSHRSRSRRGEPPERVG